jgi:hypothetical protein
LGLEVQFFDLKEMKSLGGSVEIETLNLTIPKDCEIPDYGLMRFPMGIGGYHTIPGIGKNPDY